MAEKILEVRHLKKYFSLRNGLIVYAVDDVGLDIRAGETLGLVGESGSGKSTIAYVLVGMYEATGGEIVYRGDNIAHNGLYRTMKQKGEIQIVFQDPGSSLNPKRTIRKSLKAPMAVHDRGLSRNQMNKRAEDLLEEVGLPAEFADKYPRALGGGERQLVSVARALATRPSLMILDEPTSALDVSVQAKVISKLTDLQSELGLSYLFITHDLSLMRNVADRVAILYLGRICEQAPTADFFEKPLHPYTQMLLSSIPVATREEEALKPARIVSSGEIPSPVNVPSGCAFHQRCRDMMPVCERDRPLMSEISPGHAVCCHLYANGSF
ncbi:MAG: ABC transporter ATP-binding protein [Synergistaceae bacterium]|jgi:oligopeptide/dipeptide ABC transporter ATP-binding protein|nr:ABC transporter ATP-binding protein [Synergistaceae bacterium]